MDRQIKYCNLSGNFDDTDRSLIRSEFSRFGKIRKIYITQKFTKVYFENQGSCERAVQGLSNNEFGWLVELKKEGLYQKFGNQDNSTFKAESTMEDYLDQDFVENNEYCDIHGNPLTTFQGEYTNDLFVKLNDIRRAGFAVFRRDTFDRLIANKNQIFKEFELHLLSEAKNYILKNRVCEIDEEQILKTIERCKTKLLGSQSPSSNSNDHPTGRKVASSSDRNLTIVSPISQNVPKGGYESFDSSEPVMSQRPPKVLPNNFMPSERNNTQRTFREQRNRDANGFGSDRDHSSNQDRPNKSSYRNRPREESISSNNSSRQGFNAKDRNAKYAGNSDTTQWAKPREGASHFDRRQGRDNPDRSEKSNDVSERKTRMEFEVNEHMGKVAFQDGESYEVQVCYLEKDHGKNNICWVHKNDMTSDLEDIILKLLDAGPECEMISDPMTGQICVAPYEDAWYRCKIIKKEPLFVQFLDYGNKSQVDCVKVLPDQFRKVPALATRLVFSKDENVVLEDEMDLRVRIKLKYDDGTLVVESDKQPPKPSKQQPQPHVTTEKNVEREAPQVEKSTSKPEEKKPAEKHYFDVPEPLCTLKNGDMIMICGMLDNRFTVKTRECATKTKELLEYIKSLDKSALMLSDVKKGQLVLCSIDGLPNLCRAIVAAEPSAGTAEVRYLDYAGDDLMTVKSLRNVDAHLAAHPACLLLTPPCALLGSLSDSADAAVSQLVEKKAKGKMVLNENDFDIQLDDGSYLIRDICNQSAKSEPEKSPAKAEQAKSSPKPVQAKSSPPPVQAKSVPKAEPVKAAAKKDEPPVTYDDMDWIKAEVGTTDQFICYTIKDLENVTLLSLTDDSLKYLEAVTDMAVEDHTPYEPDLYEMCMVSYKALEDPEASWYRGAVLKKEGDKITVNSVDYGTNIIVTKKDIRKFDKKYKDIPILGITCELSDIPNNEEVLEKLKEMIPEGEQLTVVMKDFDGLKYKIEIPEVSSKLKKLGLI